MALIKEYKNSKNIIEVVSKLVAKEVRLPKCIRDGLVKPKKK